MKPTKLLTEALAVTAAALAAMATAPADAESARVELEVEGRLPPTLEPQLWGRSLLAQGPMVLSEESQAFAAHELDAERLVKGAPYCADAVHESVQSLPDASGAASNRIVRRQTTKLCRDGEGRTRQEIDRDGTRRIYLRDPVAKENWVLDPVARTARRLGTPLSLSLQMTLPPGLHDGQAWREHAEQLRDWARAMADRARGVAGTAPSPMPPLPPMPAAPAAAPASPTAPAASPGLPAISAPAVAAPAAHAPTAVVIAPQGDRHEQRDIQLRILRSDTDNRLAPPALPPGMSFRAHGLAPRGTGVTTPLPAREFDGLRAHGERTTWTIEAGKMGNEKPIVITREVWRSPELLLTLHSSDFDPRSGELSYRLTKLKRGEPDAAWMKVPADYERRGRAAPARPASAPRSRA